MAHYIVKAWPLNEKLSHLKERLDSGEIISMQPFGSALDYSLRNAKLADENTAVWEELDYCSPPLAMEREAILDDYFKDLSVSVVKEGEGWKQIELLKSLWD